ncbi:uncharacterized protein METZ01_LOCUS216188 [marine metagenome]|uniref:Uncharacterized protein n=1 Tax=marine metagenome TaxID=408172 RepID=A0A382FLW1_9ZZZZ
MTYLKKKIFLLLAIAMALMFRQVLLSLVAGGLLGALLHSGYHPFMAIVHHADQLILTRVISRWSASVLLVIVILGGLIGVITRNGSVFGVVDLVSGWARTRRPGQLATMAMGLSSRTSLVTGGMAHYLIIWLVGKPPYETVTAPMPGDVVTVKVSE